MSTPSHREPLDELDRQILTELRSVLDDADPVPADLDERVRFALTVQALRVEIAELERVPGDLAGVRSPDYTQVRTVTFSSESLSAVVTSTHLDERSCRIDGWIDGAIAEVEIRAQDRTQTTAVDADGRFAFAGVRRGLVQLVFRPAADSDAKPVITPATEV